MRRIIISLAALAAAALPVACSNDKLLGGAPNPSFRQIDRVGHPGIVELFSPFANHDAFNRSAPTSDGSTIAADIGAFMTSTAGRSAATTSAVQTLLVSDVLKADTSQTGLQAGYLGLETGGKIGTLFGGRNLSDDVVDTNLNLAFGNLVATLGLAADDGAEQDGRSGRPTLNTDNVAVGTHASGPNAFTTSFPYLGAPH